MENKIRKFLNNRKLEGRNNESNGYIKNVFLLCFKAESKCWPQVSQAF